VEQNIWNDVLDYIDRRVSKSTFDTWFKPCTIKKEGTKWYIISPNHFGRDWLETQYLSLVRNAIYEITKEMPEVVFTVETKNRVVSNSNHKIATILDDINELSLTEQEKLFGLLSESSNPFSQRARPDEATRVNKLEIEVEKIKSQIVELNNNSASNE
jgi:chromosomal replication initiation ATPase DnaA